MNRGRGFGLEVPVVYGLSAIKYMVAKYVAAEHYRYTLRKLRKHFKVFYVKT